MIDQWTLRLVLEGPFGERYQTAIGVDGFYVRDNLVEITPPGKLDMEFGLISFDRVVNVMKKREMRRDIFEGECMRLGRKLAQDMCDAEGWHDASRIEPMRRSLRGEHPTNK